MEKTEKISMESEKLFISIDKIDVEYLFLNNSNETIDAIVAFPLAPISICTQETSDFGSCNDSALNIKFATLVDPEKPDQESVVSLCFDGLQKISPTRFMVTKKNFILERDLSILFLRAARK